MTEYSLSICMPSKRGFDESRASISSAINFCDSTGSELVISDNSGSSDKSKMWNQILLPFMKYLSNKKNENLLWSDNWYNGMKNCSGSFIGIVSDDDILVNIDKSVLEYKDIKYEDIVGIKPIISLWNSQVGVYKQNNFNINANTAVDRIKQYQDSNKGNNTSYFTFYRSKIIKDIFKLLKYHPTQGGYTDWSIVLSCVASGKILVDPTKQLIYRNSNWFGDAVYIKKQISKLYIECGLEEKGVLIASLLDALDSFILIMRESSNLAIDEKLEAAEYVLNTKINQFINNFNITVYHKFPDVIKNKVEILKAENKIDKKLDICLEIISSFFPSLKDKYKKFYKYSTNLEWGNLI